MSLPEIMMIKLKQDLLTKCKEYDGDIDIDVLHRLIESRTQDVVFDFSEDKCKLKKEERCCARTWTSMKGLQCNNRCNLEGDYCGNHTKNLEKDGVLRFGDIRESPPEFDLIKLKSGWTEPLKHLWRPSAEQELQTLLDRQSKKVIVCTPKLILD